MKNQIIEVIKDSIYFLIKSPPIQDSHEYHFFTVNQLLPYIPVDKEIGPLPLTSSFQFFQILDQQLQFTTKKLVLYSSPEPSFYQNSILLLSTYLLLHQNQSINTICSIFHKYEINFSGTTLQQILASLKKAVGLQFINFNTFQWQYQAFYQSIENGNVSEIIPNGLLVFPGPIDIKHPNYYDHPFHPKSYIPLFESKNLTAIIRLNSSQYNRNEFMNANIHHFDLIFEDNQPPPDMVVKQFFSICQHEKFIGIHSQKSIGRAATLACCYLIRIFRFKATEAIAYLRIFRPGSISQKQQYWLIKNEPRLHDTTDFVNTFQAKQSEKMVKEALKPHEKVQAISPMRVNDRVGEFVNSPVRQLHVKGFSKGVRLPIIK
ncbi:Dual specificity protein phosphatase CDC14A [Spironucleus salmonicida]|uniref:protein-tyrosine-phosphatase n=1 Tax=Spironucleus salmonicida TaxID=348837 RepID=V6LJI4_9EUKA|nr:Dual specificity protein phosphatase CDC14A [Spironucleus salmonicida]|eukprot:EST44543.1 Dual specificity phosphatase [Spironucleus salmonicida]